MFRKKYETIAIINGLISGDPKIYKYLDATYRKQVIHYVCLNSGFTQDGEELYQDVVFEVYLNIERGKYDSTRSQFGTYFMMIARNRWRDKLRKKHRAIPTIPLTDSTKQMVSLDVSEGLDNYNEKVRVMRKCIAQLKEDEQEMIRLFYFTKMSLETVATNMNISYGYAKQKIHRIREKLRKLLIDHPDLKLQFKLYNNTTPLVDEYNKYPN